MEQELINSLLDGAPTPELRKVIKDRIDTYNSAMNGDVRAMVWMSGEVGLCTKQESSRFLQEYGHLIDAE